MSDSFELQNVCDHADSIKSGRKFCGSCGMDIKALVEQHQASVAVDLDPKMAEQFRVFVRDVLLDGNEVSEVLDALLDGAADMGVSSEDAVRLIEQVKTEQASASILDLKLAYDVSAARAGVANGTTPLAFRIENTSKKNIQKLSISIYHPETKHRIHFKPVTGLLRGMTKTVSIEMQLALVGFHSVRDGILTAQSLTGAVEEYGIASEIRIYADNSDAARANINTQTFTTNMGGVLSADAAQAGGALKSQSGPVWETVKLVRLVEAQETADEPVAQQSEQAPAPVQAMPAPPVMSAELEDKPTLPVEPLAESLTSAESFAAEPSQDDCDHAESIKNGKNFCALCGMNVRALLQQAAFVTASASTPAPATIDAPDVIVASSIAEVEPERTQRTENTEVVATAATKESTEPTDAFAPEVRTGLKPIVLELGPPFRILQQEDFANEHKVKTVFEDLLEDFARLWQLMAKADPRGLDVVWLRQQIDYFTLRRISERLGIETHEILAVNPAVDSINSSPDRIGERSAVLLGTSGLYFLRAADESADTDFLPCATWARLDEHQCDFSIKTSTQEGAAHAIVFGDDEADLLVFDVSKSLDPSVAEELVTRAKTRLAQIISTDEIIRNFQTSRDAQAATTEADSPSPPAAIADSIRISAIKKFFTEYALISSFHDHTSHKSIHVYNSEDAHLLDVDTELADFLQDQVLGSLDPVVITVASEEQFIDEDGRLSGWCGLASVLTQDGIYHVVSAGDDEYELADDDSFLSWESFFALSGNIQYRSDTPDIWLGTPSSVLLKGSYFDFSQNIAGWIRYFDEHKTELRKSFNAFSQSMQAGEA